VASLFHHEDLRLEREDPAETQSEKASHRRSGHQLALPADVRAARFRQRESDETAEGVIAELRGERRGASGHECQNEGGEDTIHGEAPE